MTHEPGRTFPEPVKHTGPPPIPDFTDAKAALGPARMSLRDLALGLKLGTIKIVDYAADPTDPEAFLDRFLDDGKSKASRAYDPMRIYTSSTNKHDHRAQIRLNLPPDVLSAVRQIVGIVPQFGSDSAFIRDAILHSLQHWLKRLDGFLDDETISMVNFATMHAVLLSTQDDIDNRRQMIESMSTVFDDAMRDGDVEKVDAACDVMDVVMESAPEGLRERMAETVARARQWSVNARKERLVREAKARAEKMKAEKDEARWLAEERGEGVDDWMDG